MPHKHKRKRDDDASNFDLAPDNRAKPLAAYNKASIFTESNSGASKKRPKPNQNKKTTNKSSDDTPKAFARLMAMQAHGKRLNGLDDGNSKKKERRKQMQPHTKPSKLTSMSPRNEKPSQTSTPSAAATTTTTTTASPKPTHPKILPGESLSAFALRVDQTLPLNNITQRTPNPTLPADLQSKLKKSQRTTKHNRRLQRMQADWRDTETRLRQREADEADELEDEREGERLLWAGVRSASHARKGKKRKTKTGEAADDDDDPWKALDKKRRAETRQKNLQDVVKAPPSLVKVNKAKFKTRPEDYEALDGDPSRRGDDEGVVAVVDVGDVPNAAGRSLRRREELNATRKAVVEEYRRMRGRKRGVEERLDLARAVVS